MVFVYKATFKMLKELIQEDPAWFGVGGVTSKNAGSNSYSTGLRAGREATQRAFES